MWTVSLGTTHSLRSTENGGFIATTTRRYSLSKLLSRNSETGLSRRTVSFWWRSWHSRFLFYVFILQYNSAHTAWTLAPPLSLVVNATDHYKAVVLVLFLFCVALWSLLWMFYVESCLAFCSRCCRGGGGRGEDGGGGSVHFALW